MNLTFSLMVLFLLFLKGLFGQTDTVFFLSGSVCAPAGSTVALGSKCLYPGWIFQSWKLRINNTETLADPSKDSRYSYSKDLSHRCYLLIRGLKETDAGTYYMSFIYREGDISFTSNSQSEFTVHVTDVVYESAGILALSSLLIPVLLLLVCLALWMIRTKQQNLKRPEVKEQSKQNENVYENESTPHVTFDLEEKVKSVHQEEEVQYSCVHLSRCL